MRMNYSCDGIPWQRIHGLTFPLQKTTKKESLPLVTHLSSLRFLLAEEDRSRRGSGRHTSDLSLSLYIYIGLL